MQGNTFLLFEPSRVWYFVMAAQENWYTRTQMYRVAREGGEEEKICVEVPSTEHPHSATCDWTPSMSQVLSQLRRIQQWANWHIFCPSSTDSLSVSSPWGLVKDASQHSLDPSPLGVTYSPTPTPTIYIWMGTRMLDPSPLPIWEEETLSASAADVEELLRIERRESWRWEGLLLLLLSCFSRVWLCATP